MLLGEDSFHFCCSWKFYKHVGKAEWPHKISDPKGNQLQQSLLEAPHTLWDPQPESSRSKSWKICLGVNCRTWRNEATEENNGKICLSSIVKGVFQDNKHGLCVGSRILQPEWGFWLEMWLSIQRKNRPSLLARNKNTAKSPDSNRISYWLVLVPGSSRSEKKNTGKMGKKRRKT